MGFFYHIMNHLDLFSGIGGFSLAARWVWGKEHNIIGFCEIDKFCQKVLKKHWPNVTIFPEIKELKGYQFEAVDLITGGVPCQPASVAGKRRGTKDDRWLWKQTFEVIRHIKPRFCILENVRGILSLEGGMVFENLLLELESYGYETATFIIPACAVNAPHRRDRVWIIANSKDIGRKWRDSDKRKISGKNGKWDAITGLQRQALNEKQTTGIEQCAENASNTTGTGLEGEMRKIKQGNRGRFTTQDRRQSEYWNENWYEIAAEICRVDARIPNRVDRLKSLGNSIVPQVVMEIMYAIKNLGNNYEED